VLPAALPDWVYFERVTAPLRVLVDMAASAKFSQAVDASSVVGVLQAAYRGAQAGPNPRYGSAVQHNDALAGWRAQVVQWLLEVSEIEACLCVFWLVLMLAVEVARGVALAIAALRATPEAISLFITSLCDGGSCRGTCGVHGMQCAGLPRLLTYSEIAF
jgi:hypothetical protein